VGTEWEVETVVASSGRVQECSMVLDASGIPHIAFEGKVLETYGMHYATKPDGAWVFENIIEDTAGIGSIALRQDGTPGIGYVTTPDGLHTQTYFALRSEGNWLDELVTDLSIGGNLHFIADDIPLIIGISFISHDEHTLEAAFKSSTEWQVSRISLEGQDVTHVTSLVDASDMIGVRYSARGEGVFFKTYW